MRTLLRAFARHFVVAAMLFLLISPPRRLLAEEAELSQSQPTAAEKRPDGPNPLAVDPDLAIWTAVVFLLLLLVLGKFAWPQITEALEERERKIADNIAAAAARH